MGLLEQFFNNVPDYRKDMYQDGFTPEEIFYASKKRMLENLSNDDDLTHVSIKVKKDGK